MRIRSQSYIWCFARAKRNSAKGHDLRQMMLDIPHEHQALKYDLPGAVKSLAGGGRAKSGPTLD